VCEKLQRYDWCGNVRELANILERAVTLGQSRVLQAEHIGIFSKPGLTDERFATLEETERCRILQAFAK
jgi:two-component system response regulator PilR (NtrC family)